MKGREKERKKERTRVGYVLLMESVGREKDEAAKECNLFEYLSIIRCRFFIVSWYNTSFIYPYPMND